jgi:two-component system sensor histidine kinase RegB
MSLLSLPGRSAAQRNLARLCLLRMLLIAGVVMAAALAEWLHEVPLLHDDGVLLALALLTGFNLATLAWLRRGLAVGEGGLLLQLGVDVLLMTVVLYRTGGATNPFVSYYLVPLTIAAATLRQRYTLALAIFTLTTYTLLLFDYVPFAPFGGMMHGFVLVADDPALHEHMMHFMPAGGGSAFNVHVFGMWLNFLLSTGLITFFVSRMSSALREQDRRLAEQHESLLQREQVVALGALAAGAAHELGTPLSTMAVIARDVEAGLPGDSPLREDMAVLRRQLGLCRDILGSLREQASGAPARLPLERFVAATVERMEVMHPALQFALSAGVPACSVQPPATVQQVLVSLLDNAAQAARSVVTVTVRDDGADGVVDIDDDGAGIDPDVAARLGSPFVSSKRDGLGIGYFLSHATVNPLGGSIRLQQRPDGGTRTCLRLPWTALRTEPLP